MLTQWECFLKNLGEWQGSFTRLSSSGELLEDTPTMVSFEAQENNTKVHQIVRRFHPDKPPTDLVLDYTSLNRSILFFENGAFCQGSMQWGPFSEFGGEFGLMEGDRRLRVVMLFNTASKFEQLTLIREKLAGSNTPEKPPLTIEQLIGQWQGKATTMYPDLRPCDTFSTHLQFDLLDDRHLEQKLSFSDRTLSSVAEIDGSILKFSQSQTPVQILLLPDGASCNCPIEIKPRQRFVLEVGWLISPTKRQRLIRNFDEKGEWLNVTLVEEEKV